VVAAVVEAGFARHFVPERFGGAAGPGAPDYRGVLAAVAEIGLGCASTAWFASLTASLGRMAGFLPQEAQQTLWADGPDPVIVGALMPSGRALPVPGGWRVSGSWSYVSGASASEWALLCAPALSDTGEPPQARFFAIPRSQYSIVESWFTVGMRGTGSNTVTVQDAHVAEAFSVPRDDLLAGRDTPETAPAYRAPLRAINGLTFAAPLLGAARGALAAYLTLLAAKPGPAADPVVELVGRVDAAVETAALLLDRVARAAERGEHGPAEVARAMRDCAFAADLLPGAVDRLVRAAGTAGLSEHSSLQRFWRDVTTGASHVVLRLDAAAAGYGARLVGRAAKSAPGRERRDRERPDERAGPLRGHRGGAGGRRGAGRGADRPDGRRRRGLGAPPAGLRLGQLPREHRRHQGCSTTRCGRTSAPTWTGSAPTRAVPRCVS
jgi:two-component flavin-dependent monooxygenase